MQERRRCEGVVLISDVQPLFSRVGSLSVELSLRQCYTYHVTGRQIGHIDHHRRSRVPTLAEDQPVAVTGTRRTTAAITKLSDPLRGSLHVINRVAQQSLGVEASRTLSPLLTFPTLAFPLLTSKFTILWRDRNVPTTLLFFNGHWYFVPRGLEISKV